LFKDTQAHVGQPRNATEGRYLAAKVPRRNALSRRDARSDCFPPRRATGYAGFQRVEVENSEAYDLSDGSAVRAGWYLMPKHPFPIAIDSTTLGTFRSCPIKMYRQYMEHWKPVSDSVHLIAGGAFADGIEAARRAFYEQGMDSDSSVAVGLESLIRKYGDFECPPDSAKSLERTAGALEFYFANYPLGEDGAIPLSFPDGRRGIEFSFACPLPINHPVTGDPILYTGRSDMIAEYANGIYIFDEKTTSQLGSSWSRQWEMRSQFTGYVWAARQYGIQANGTIVRGVSILKTKYDTQQAITYRAPHEVTRWEDQTCRDIERMIESWKSDTWDYNLDHSCAEYGGCTFQNICKSPDPEAWLPMYFEQRVWNPLARQQQTVEEYEAELPPIQL
jgi:hypothetical protein